MITPTLPTLPPASSLGLALQLPAAPNLRDLGGYSTATGNSTRRQLLYRSDLFNPIPASHFPKLQLLRLKTNIDLRSPIERQKHPDQLPGNITHLHLDVLADAPVNAATQLDHLLEKPNQVADALAHTQIETFYQQTYRQLITLPSAQRAYRQLYLTLADPNNLPAVFHCTAGKDRTGWAAAALLSLLGVPRETILADYLRSNAYILPHYAPLIARLTAKGIPASIPTALFSVKPSYLAAAFQEMENTYTTIESYFTTALQISEQQQHLLRTLLLE